MLISEMVVQLNAFTLEHGDLPVIVSEWKRDLRLEYDSGEYYTEPGVNYGAAIVIEECPKDQ